MGNVHRKTSVDPSIVAYNCDQNSPPTFPISFGDFVRWSNSAGMVKRLTSGQGWKFLGVAGDADPASSNIDTDAMRVNRKVKVNRQGIFRFKTTPGDTYVHRTPCVVGADEQTVKAFTNEFPMEVICFAHLPDGSTVTGATGVEVEVELRCCTDVDFWFTRRLM